MEEDTMAEVWSFPTDVSKFNEDERISFSKLDGKYIAVQEDGNEFEFDQALKRWIPHADDDENDMAVAAQLAAYGDRDTMEDGRDPKKNGVARQGQKRKQDQAYGHEPSDTSGKRRNDASSSGGALGISKRARAAQTAPKPRQNTAVYVTGLPSDATVDEVAELFSRKCGVIAEEIDSGRPRIKLYTDADGQFKGDALVVFFKPQSVDMAIMLLDDTEFRFSPTAADAPRMRVQAADASYKKTSYGEAGAPGGNSCSGLAAAGTASGGQRTSTAGEGQTKAGARGNQDKQKIIKKTQKLDAKLADWSSDEERPFGDGGGGGGSGGIRSSKWDKVVVLKHMFTLEELEEDAAALLDIKEDIREECAKLGEVTNVVLFDQEAAGVVSVKFRTTAAAAACVRLMDGRAFAGQVVEASIATGREKYKKAKSGDGEDESEED
ncbi:nuclear mRNA splicing factor-associated protein [Grosmannia clavigera kw1407]|uniref:Nuclear mRNA splicing factor-associated protein n=1 Tax=Grosmannia clavigera (strain kw1407 / UAMH 11150) TaxID=655863 RepID=F0XIF2_GROCL|nr:nuclear mRNA splicing factor-associated protein [Grosmannia clavigera kw1407]EFX02483.1 nuclear mRNA splicing factor-associated protein [Grosmannia clavigera kw1407]